MTIETFWGFVDPASHAWMLLDERRVDAYARAIAARVRPGDVVLDLGTGSGVLAILAARAGARRVFAVDRTGIVEVARRHVADNGVADVVEVIRADVTELDALPEPPGVILGELLGHFAPAEQLHRLYASARRLTAPRAIAIPSRYRLVAGAIEARGLRADMARLGDVHGVRLGALAGALRARPAFARVDAAELLGPEVDGPWIDVDAPPPGGHVARLPADRDGEVGAITLGFVAELAPGIELATGVAAPHTHWTQSIFPVDPPLPVRAGETIDVELWFRVITNPSTWAWRVAGREVREVDAFAEGIGDHADLLAQLRARPVGGRVTTSQALRGWAAALGVELGPTIDVEMLAARAREALPGRYPTIEEARQEVVEMLRAAEEL